MKAQLKEDEIAARAANQSHAVQPDAAKAVPALRAFNPAEKEARSNVPRLLAGTQPVYQFQEAAPQPHSVSEAPLPKAAPVARLFQDIVQEAAVIRRFQSDSVAVVLRPDAHTEISLRLTFKHGEIEAQARCEQGDLDRLNLHWAELRQSLQQQGVRLHELSARPGAAFEAGTGSSGFSRQNAHPFPQPEDFGATPMPNRVPAADTVCAVSAVNSTTPNRLLESWA